MEFEKLKLEPQKKGISGLLQSKHFRKSALAIIIGGVAGIALFYFTEGRHMESMAFSDIIKYALLGSFLGFFVTNSPCARNKC